MERSRDNRRGNMSRPCTSFGKHSAQTERIKFYGISKRNEQLADIPRFGNMKFVYRNREFWYRGYYVDTVGKNTKAIKEYIAN